MKQGMSYTCKEKTIILNVFKYFRIQFPEKCVTDIVRRTARATGCSEKSVFQFRKEEASVEGFKEPSKTKIRKNININSRDIKYDNTVRQAIRSIIYDLQYKNIVPSLNTILKQVNADSQLPNFSLMTLRRLMFDMGFSYQKNGTKSILVERPDTRFVEALNEVHTKLNLTSLLPPLPSNPLNAQPNENLNTSNVNKLPSYTPPDPRYIHPLPKPLNMPTVPTSLGPQPNAPPMMASHSEMLHSSSHSMMHKAMPIMVNHQRVNQMIPPSMAPSMDIYRKRDAMVPWMQGMIKQGQ